MAKTDATALRYKLTFGEDMIDRVLPGPLTPAMAALQMGYMGIFDAGEDYYVERERHEACQFLFCHGGCGHVWVDNGWKVCRPGMVYWMPAMALHRYRPAEKQRWSCTWVFYDIRPGGLFAAFHPAGPCLLSADPWPFHHAVSGMLAEYFTTRRPEMLDRWGEILHQYVLALLRHDHAHGQLSELWRRVDERLAEPWTLSRLAALTAHGEETLRRLCRHELGYPPMQQVVRLRLHRAQTLLRGTDQKVETIARAVGFGSAFALSKAFRRHLGTTPGVYRANPKSFKIL